MNGEQEIEADLVNNLDDIRVKILMNNIRKTTRKVKDILNSLRNIDHDDKMKILNDLKNTEVISEPEFHRLLTSNNNIMSYAKAIQGSGIWV